MPSLNFDKLLFSRNGFRACCAAMLLPVVLPAALMFAPPAHANPEVDRYVLSRGALDPPYTTGAANRGYIIALPNPVDSITITARPLTSGSGLSQIGNCLCFTTIDSCLGTVSASLVRHSSLSPAQCKGDLQATYSNLTVGSLVIKVMHYRNRAWREGDTVTVIRQTLPDPPDNLRLVAEETGALKATWTAPTSNLAEPAAGYRIRWAKGADPTRWINPAAEVGEAVNSASTLTYKITSLEPLTTYAMQAASVNTSGLVGVWSDSVNARTLSTLPAAPTALMRISSDSLGKLSLSWTAPADPDEAPVTEHRVRWRLLAVPPGNWQKASGDTGDDEDGEVVTVPEVSYTISALLPGMTYEVQAATRNNLGQSPWSATLTTVPVTLPAPPAPVTFEALDDALTLNWTAPPNPPGAPVKSYRVRWRTAFIRNVAVAGPWQKATGDTSGATDGQVVTVPGSSYTISDLQNGVSYDVQIAAFNAGGLGRWASVLAIPSSLQFVQPNLRHHSGNQVRETLVSVKGGMSPYVYVLTGVPDGFSFDEQTLVLRSDAPTELLTSPLEHPLVYTVTDSDMPPVVAVQNFTLTLAPPLAFVAAPAPMTFLFNSPANSVLPGTRGGFTPIVYSIGTPPFGLEFDSDAHTISGLPNAVGSADLVYTATDDVGVEVRTAFRMQITAILPSSPTGLRVTGVDRRLMLVWDAPSGAGSGGEAPSGYRVRWVRSSDPNTWVNPSGEDGEAIDADTSHTITELTNNLEYEAQVAAVNSAGAGAWSALASGIPVAGSFFVEQASNLTFAVTGDPVAPPALPLAEGGTAPYTYALTGLPSGLNFDADTRAISGTPATSGTPTAAATPRTEVYTLTYEAIDSTSAKITVRFSVTIVAHAFDLDINADGSVTAHDGILIARYLLGVRAAALTAPQRNADHDAVASRAADGVRTSDLDVDGADGVNGEDGIMLARYLLGLRGAALTDGLAATDHAAVETNMQALLNPQ